MKKYHFDSYEKMTFVQRISRSSHHRVTTMVSNVLHRSSTNKLIFIRKIFSEDWLKSIKMKRTFLIEIIFRSMMWRPLARIWLVGNLLMNHLCSVYQSTQHLFVIFLFQKMASNSSYRLDQRISIAGKGAGTIAFIGKTEFADGNRTKLFFFSDFAFFFRWMDWYYSRWSKREKQRYCTEERWVDGLFDCKEKKQESLQMERRFDIFPVMIIMDFMFERDKSNRF